jgi:hypothetical protein
MQAIDRGIGDREHAAAAERDTPQSNPPLFDLR